MATKLDQPQLASNIRSTLSGLRQWIRSYVWIEGLAIAVAWLGLTFWVALAIDYGPVWLGRQFGGIIPSLAGLPESSIALRGVLLAAITGVFFYVLYRWIGLRAFRPMADHSMAVLLERRFSDFQDSLVTSVEMAEHPDHAAEFNPRMLAHTNDDAQSRIGQVRLAQVFNFSPMQMGIMAVLFFALTIGGLAITSSGFFLQAAQRIYMLDATPWPRSAKIEVVGIEVVRMTVSSSGNDSQLLTFDGQPVKVAKGSSVLLKVRADTKCEKVPDVCTVFYRTATGESSWENMNRIGSTLDDGFQHFELDGKPFKGVLSDITFEVVGFDHKIGEFEIKVVDNPVLAKTMMHCVFPEYMIDKENLIGLPREQLWTSGTQMPVGTEIKLVATANKPLTSANVFYPDANRSETIEVNDDTSFSIQLPRLDKDISLEITLHDADGVVAETPERIYIAAVLDEAPTVRTLLSGIGSAVTAFVRIPLALEIDDDYRVDRAWIEVQAPGIETYEHPIDLPKSGKVASEVDFRELRDRETDPIQLTPAENAKLVITVKASDRFDLTGQANIGSGDRYELDIVTSDQLLAILDREEAGQRRRLEQIHQEMSDARDWLFRVKADGLASENAGAEPDDKPAAGSEPDDKKEDLEKVAQRLHSLRLLFAQRSLLQTRKSAQEVLGVAATFQDIREQLENNRIDAEDRKLRLQDEVAVPLKRIGEVMFADLELGIEALEKKLQLLEKDLKSEKSINEANEAAQIAVDQADDLLAELDIVLRKLIKFETYAELLDIVRELIQNQEDVTEATKEENKKDLFGDKPKGD